MIDARILRLHQYGFWQICEHVFATALFFVLLFTLPVYADDANERVSEIDDQWIAFEEAQEDEEVEPMAMVYNAQWNLQGLWRSQAERTTPLSPVSDEDPWYLTLLINGESYLWFEDRLRVSIDAGLKITNEDRYAFQHEHPSVSREDVKYMTFFTPGFRELSMYYRLTPSFSTEVGLLPVKLGSTIFFNPINYVERFWEESSAIGADTFLGVKTFFSLTRHSFALIYIPAVFQGNAVSYFSDVFQVGKTNNLLVAQSNHYMWDGRLSFLGVLEEKEPWTWKEPYFGFGTEASMPMSSWTLNAQTLLSNGDARSTLQELEEFSNSRYFLVEPASKETFFLETFVLATVPFQSSHIELSLGYYYNGRGLSPSEQYDLLNALRQTPHLGLIQSANGIGDSALPYTRHVGLLNFSYPNITRHMGINNLIFLNLVDGSGKFQSYYYYDLSDTITLDVVGMMNFGDTSTLFGVEFLKAAVTLGMTMYF
jgi:hypothetical protein